MGFIPSRLLGATTLVAVFAWTAGARAMDPPPDGATLEEVRAYENRLRTFTVLGDAVVLLTGHISFEAQVVPWVHHAFRLNPFCTVADPSLPILSTSLNSGFQLACGGELGYRYYTGHRGANGFFAGPSLVVGHTHADAGTDIRKQPLAAADFFYMGGAIDVGVQGMHESGFTLGGGVGFLLLRNLAPGSVVKPDARLFIDVGYSFP
jgi:hypothetical protein